MKYRVPRPPRAPRRSRPKRTGTLPGYRMPVPPRPVERSVRPDHVTYSRVPAAAQQTAEIDLREMDDVLSKDRRELVHDWFGDEISEVAIDEYAEARRSLLVRVALLLGFLSAGLTATALAVVG